MEMLEKIYEHICELILKITAPESIKTLTEALMNIEALKRQIIK